MAFQTLVRSLCQTFIDLISPPICASCKDFLSERVVMCGPCAARIVPIVSLKFAITATYDVTVFAISDYQDPLRKLILAKNYADRVSARQLGQLVWQMTAIAHQPIDFFVPIPLHWTRTARRGFNQAHEMAIALSFVSGATIAPLLTRTKRTQFQAALGHAQRAVNLDKAFVLRSCDKELYCDKHLVLVDDLMTTGSTIKEAVRLLRSLKPASITVVVACRVV
jgi:ComF family protein